MPRPPAPLPSSSPCQPYPCTAGSHRWCKPAPLGADGAKGRSLSALGALCTDTHCISALQEPCPHGASPQPPDCKPSIPPTQALYTDTANLAFPPPQTLPVQHPPYPGNRGSSPARSQPLVRGVGGSSAPTTFVQEYVLHLKRRERSEITLHPCPGCTQPSEAARPGHTSWPGKGHIPSGCLRGRPAAHTPRLPV